MKKMQTPGLLAFIALFTFLVCCTSGKKNPNASADKRFKVTPPTADVNVIPVTYSIIAEKGGTIVHEKTGTRITIPASAFSDKNGNPVKGSVSLSYREFHTVSDIILSGIPMKFINGDKEENFESAGMFEIGASCNGENVEIANGKSLQVNMASYKEESDFNFYRFDTAAGRWIELSRNSVAEVNRERETKIKTLQQKLDENKPLEPQKADANTRVYDFDIDLKKYPEYQAFSGMLWQFAGIDPSLDPANNSWIFTSEIADFKLEKSRADNKLFNVTFRSGEKELATTLRPVLTGKNYVYALNSYKTKQNQYRKEMEQEIKAYEVLDEQAKLMRSFTVSNFGIYNCDRFYGIPNVAKVRASFIVPGGAGSQVYLVCSNSKAVVPVYGSEMTFSPNEKNMLVTLNEDGRVSYVPTYQFSRTVASAGRGGRADFVFNVYPKKISSPRELEAIIASY